MRRKPRKTGGGNYLILLNSLNSNTIPIRLIGCNICITKLAMPQQLPYRIPPIKVLIKPEIGSFPTGNARLLGSTLDNLLGMFLLLLGSIIFIRIIGRELLLVQRNRGRRRGGRMLGCGGATTEVGVGVGRCRGGGGGGGVGVGVAIGTTHFCGGQTTTHFSGMISKISLFSNSNLGPLIIQPRIKWRSPQ